MSDSSVHDLIDELADEFLSRRLAGDSPSISEYCLKHPELQDQIRSLFSTLDLLEIIKPDARSKADRLPHPARIADYRIDRVIGQGGMGVVYEAIHESLERRVALKVVNRQISDDANAVARFQREARAIAKLHHTNIVPLFEVGEDEGRLFLAMQLIPGKSLDRIVGDLKEASSTTAEKPWADLLQSQAGSSTTNRLISTGSGSDISTTRLSASSLNQQRYRWIARIGLQAADALAYAHDRGVVHRDIKPSNLLLDDSGVVWLTDFGLAKTEEDDLTRTGEFVGTLRYMAPEQFDGSTNESCDVYSLGTTLYELLALRPAFDASDRVKMLRQIQDSSPPKLRDIDSRIPRDLETIVMKAMDREPASRYKSAKQISEDLSRFIHDEPIHARRLSPLEKLNRWGRRNKKLATALSTSFVLLVSLIIVLGWTSVRQTELRRLSDQRGEDLERNLYLAQMNIGGQAAVQRYGTSTIRARLAEWNPLAGEKDLRNWEWYYLYALSHREQFVSEPQEASYCWRCEHSPDGSRVAVAVHGVGVQVRDAITGSIVGGRFLGSAGSVDWSPDGKQLAVGRHDGLCTILEAQSFEPVIDLELPSESESIYVKWHPNSRWLAEVSVCNDGPRGTIRIYDSTSGDLTWSIPTGMNVVNHVVWRPDGLQLACSSGKRTKVWSFEDGEPAFEFQTRGTNAIWNPDGSVLAVDRSDGCWNAGTNERLTTSSGTICWAPNSRNIAIGGNDGVIRIYNPSTAALRREFLGHESKISSLSWSPTGTSLVSTGFTDNTIRLWQQDINDGNQWLAGDSLEHIVRLSQDGTRIAASAGFGDKVYLWDQSGDLLAKRDVRDLSSIAAINQDGSRVALVFTRLKLAIWDTVTDSIQNVETDELVNQHYRAFAWHEDGRLAGANHAGVGAFFVLDSSGQTILKVPDAHKFGITAIDWSKDGTRLATTAFENSGTSIIKIWNSKNGQLMHRFQLPVTTPKEIRFSHDGTKIAACCQNALLLCHIENGEIVVLDEVRERFESIDWSPDDSRIVASSPASITLWDVDSRRVALRLEAPPKLQNVCWCSQGMRIVAGCEGGVRIYDASLGYELMDQSR